MRSSIDDLTKRQRDCLRLVSEGLSSKEIAQETGLTPHTVDTYLKAAMARLGADNRRQAARLLSAHEISQGLGSPPPAIAGTAVTGETGRATGPSWITWIFPPPVGGRRNELTSTKKTFAILQVAVLGVIAVVTIALTLAGLLYTFR